MKNEIASVIGGAIGLIAIYLIKCGLESWFGLPDWITWILAVIILFVIIFIIAWLFIRPKKHS